MTFNKFQLGPLTIHVWGTLVALGIFLATIVASLRAKRRGIDRKHILDMAFLVTIGGFVGARLLYLADTPAEWSWPQVVRVSDGGMAMFGGIIGGFIAAAIYAFWNRLSLLRLADIGGPAVLLGEGIGRIGCFLIHDHLGHPTSFPLAVNVFGTPRHDVGLYLSFAGFLGWLLISWLERSRAWPKGSIGLLALLWYSLTRLLLDFLRATDLPLVDNRYWGLTVAQYFALVALVFAVFALWRLRIAQASGKS